MTLFPVQTGYNKIISPQWQRADANPPRGMQGVNMEWDKGIQATFKGVQVLVDQ